MQMHAKLLPIFLGLLPTVSRADPELRLAVKGGPNTATQDHDLRDSRNGISGGVSGGLQWALLDPLSLGGQLELLYTPRGSETVVQGESVGKVREHYVDLTATVRPELGLGPASVYLLLGGGLDLLVSAKKDDAGGTGQDITSGLHRIDVALVGAAGVAVHLPHKEESTLRLGTIFLEARHDIGLLDVDLGGGFKNRTSSLMLGLSLVLGDSPPPLPPPPASR